MENLGISLGLLLIWILSFAILFVVLRAWVYKPILAMLDRRRQTIAQGLEDARVASEARANAEKEATGILAQAQTRSQQVVREAEERASQVAREVHQNAERQAAAERERAQADLEEERNRNLGELRGQVAALAIAAAEKLIGESLDERKQRAILEEFFSGLRDGRLQGMGNLQLAGGVAEVTSALPLTPGEQETIRRELLGANASADSVTFRVDPKILGGIVVRSGDQLVDASVSGRLQGLRESLA